MISVRKSAVYGTLPRIRDDGLAEAFSLSGERFTAKLVRNAAQVLQILQEYQNERSDCKKSGDDAGIR